MEKRAEQVRSAPCVYSRYSESLRRTVPLRPAVDCEQACTGCPWNRVEKLRRRTTGVWKRGADGLLSLHFKPVQGAGGERKESPSSAPSGHRPPLGEGQRAAEEIATREERATNKASLGPYKEDEHGA